MLASIGIDIVKKILLLPRIQTTLKKSEVPLLFHEPGIESGYRPADKPWRYYFLSAFQLHNESMNVWTHFIGFFVVLAAMVHYHVELDFQNPRLFPMVIFGLCCMTFSILSTVAHLLEAKSFFAHHFVYLVDYAGVGLYGFGTMTLLSYYSTDQRFMLLFGKYVMPVNAFMSVLCCFCGCYGKLNYMRPYPIQRKLMNIIGNAVHMVLYASPLLFRIVTDDNTSQPELIRSTMIYKHLLVAITFIISVIFFATHLPEKWFPGKFDIFGYSHAFFHVVVIITVLLQFDAAIYELKTRDVSPEYSEALPDPSVLFFYLFAVLLADALIIIGFHGKAKEIAQRYEKQT